MEYLRDLNLEGKGRKGKKRDGTGREGKGREGKGREGKCFPPPQFSTTKTHRPSVSFMVLTYISGQEYNSLTHS